MKKTFAGLAAVLCASAWCVVAHAEEAAQAVDTAGWKTVAGGHGTGCATDATPYEFYVHEGDPRRVAVYFEGGGGCWNSHNCGLDGQATFDPSVDDKDRPWLKGPGVGGILDAGSRRGRRRRCRRPASEGIPTWRQSWGTRDVDLVRDQR